MKNDRFDDVRSDIAAVRDGVAALKDDLTACMSDVARKGAQTARESFHEISERAKVAGGQAARATSTFVKDRPITSLVIALGVGAIVVKLLTSRK